MRLGESSNMALSHQTHTSLDLRSTIDLRRVQAVCTNSTHSRARKKMSRIPFPPDYQIQVSSPCRAPYLDPPQISCRNMITMQDSTTHFVAFSIRKTRSARWIAVHTVRKSGMHQAKWWKRSPFPSSPGASRVDSLDGISTGQAARRGWVCNGSVGNERARDEEWQAVRHTVPWAATTIGHLPSFLALVFLAHRNLFATLFLDHIHGRPMVDRCSVHQTTIDDPTQLAELVLKADEVVGFLDGSRDETLHQLSQPVRTSPFPCFNALADLHAGKQYDSVLTTRMACGAIDWATSSPFSGSTLTATHRCSSTRGSSRSAWRTCRSRMHSSSQPYVYHC